MMWMRILGLVLIAMVQQGRADFLAQPAASDGSLLCLLDELQAAVTALRTHLLKGDASPGSAAGKCSGGTNSSSNGTEAEGEAPPPARGPPRLTLVPGGEFVLPLFAQRLQFNTHALRGRELLLGNTEDGDLELWDHVGGFLLSAVPLPPPFTADCGKLLGPAGIWVLYESNYPLMISISISSYSRHEGVNRRPVGATHTHVAYMEGGHEERSLVLRAFDDQDEALVLVPPGQGGEPFSLKQEDGAEGRLAVTHRDPDMIRIFSNTGAVLVEQPLPFSPAWDDVVTSLDGDHLLVQDEDWSTLHVLSWSTGQTLHSVTVPGLGEKEAVWAVTATAPDQWHVLVHDYVHGHSQLSMHGNGHSHTRVLAYSVE